MNIAEVAIYGKVTWALELSIVQPHLSQRSAKSCDYFNKLFIIKPAD